MNIPIKSDTLATLISDAIDQADNAAHEIFELETLPLEPGETRLDRANLVSHHALMLAEAWAVIDGIMAHGPLLKVSHPPVMQGCLTVDTN